PAGHSPCTYEPPAGAAVRARETPTAGLIPRRGTSALHAPPGARRMPGGDAEYAREMALIREAASERDFAQPAVRIPQELQRLRDAPRHQPAMRGYAHRLAEGVREMPGGQAAEGSELGNGDVGGKIPGHVVDDPVDLPL